MKKYLHTLFVVVAVSLTSCLKGGLDDLPEFEGNDITTVQRVEYRYISDKISGASGQPIVKFVVFNNKATVDAANRRVAIEVTVPAASADFPEAERAKSSTGSLAVMVGLSTAARIAPIGGAPKLGVPGDWSKPNRYLVTAANGATKEWTIEITSFTK